MSLLVSEEQLKQAAKAAVEKTFKELCRDHPETFYYVSLTTSGEASPPAFTAWSHEALAREVEKSTYQDPVDSLKWSYGESPYFCFGEQNLAELKRLFSLRPQMVTSMSDAQWSEEYEFRMRALESAMRELDLEGLFGVGPARNKVVINVEVMPPDRTNTERANRLNPPEALVEWLAENDNS
jgi:hypothetical protein